MKKMNPVVDAMLKPLVKQIDYLASRWADESQYEDFKDYRQAVKKALLKVATLTRMAATPFTVEFTHTATPGFTYVVKVLKTRINVEVFRDT